MTTPPAARARSRTIATACWLSLLAICGLVGCQSGGEDPRNGSLRDTGRELFAKGPSAGTPASRTDWTIMVGAYTGPDQARQARTTQAVVQSLGFSDAFTEVRGKTTIVGLARYPEPGDPRAQEDLARIREFIVDGQRPYARAMMVPPEVNAGGAMSELDLRSAKDKYGRRAIFTLQVGVYSRPDAQEPTQGDLAQFRKAAEEAAARLRREGDEAFFFHGPFRSMVTVGVFDYSDSDKGAGKPESQRLVEARKKHPYNLLNGSPYRAKRSGSSAPSGKTDDFVKSDLVEIPQN
ncbi:MAG: hypothetical protein IT436_02635 [Phycisphaerales bacterium]|nr:hypothetical protein [Phycisphaerales bacterium]